jgi:biotin transport system substrate-specific component
MIKIKDLVYIALFAALTAGLALFPPFFLPIGVPITAQSMGAMLAGGILGAKRGALALLLFLLLGAMGVPVFAGGRGGLALFFGPTAGFALSWPLAALVIGALFDCFKTSLTFFKAICFVLLGSVVISYAIGILWLSKITGFTLNKAATSTLLFIPGDLIKSLITARIVLIIKRIYPSI